MKIKCNVFAEVRNHRGEFLYRSSGHNRLVDTGRQHMRDLFGGIAPRADQMQAGIGTGETTEGMPALESSVVTKDVTRRIMQTYGIEIQTLLTTADANGYDLSEVGTFQGDILIARALLDPVIPKTALIQVTLSHVFTFEAASNG